MGSLSFILSSKVYNIEPDSLLSFKYYMYDANKLYDDDKMGTLSLYIIEYYNDNTTINCSGCYPKKVTSFNQNQKPGWVNFELNLSFIIIMTDIIFFVVFFLFLTAKAYPLGLPEIYALQYLRIGQTLHNGLNGRHT